MNKHILTGQVPLLGQLGGEIHVWFCFPEKITDQTLISYYQTLLSEEEKKRYHQFIFEKDRHSYLVAHALVRRVLSKYVNVEPSAWQFKANAFGRPEIQLPEIDVPLRFNLTHTKGLCACIVTLQAACGIDAEMILRKNNLMSVAKRMFSSAEFNVLQQLDEADVSQSFFKYWTLREAYVKAIGAGLAGSSKNFYFQIEDENQISIRLNAEYQASGVDARQWQFALFEPTEKHISAIAVQNAEQSELRVLSQFIQP